MPRLFFIHGYGGSPEDERFMPALQELERREYRVHVLAMPEPDHPRKDAWIRALREAIGTPDHETFLIGFSLGCITILRYLEEVGRERGVASSSFRQVGDALLLAGFFEDLGPDFIELHSFVEAPVDWEAVRRSCPAFSVAHGDDDPLVPLPFAERLAVRLGVPLQVEHAVGHFNTAYGVQRVGEVITEWGTGVTLSPSKGDTMVLPM